MGVFKQIHDNFKLKEDELNRVILNFDNSGEAYGNQDRNSLKLYQLDDKTINVKSFRVPNIINKIAYRYFRKSKAQRSFEYAKELVNLNVGTPQPIAFYEFKSLFFFGKSYYVSEHLDYDITYRELTTDFDIPNYENVLRAFTRFTFDLHEKGIHFLDHSPGNTLIQYNNGDYKFYLVDLNRMEFKSLNFETRIKNFSRLTIHKSMIEIMSDEYAKCSGESYEKIVNLMWNETEKFQYKFHRKRRVKNKILFWRIPK